MKTKLAFAALAAASLFAAAPVAAAQQQYIFTGACSDCAGFGIGVLTLNDYTPGETLGEANFVSFDYTSNLVPNLRIETLDFISGAIPATPGPASLYFQGLNVNAGPAPGPLDRAASASPSDTYGFDTQSNGYWSVAQGGVPNDFGFAHSFSAASVAAAPEPAAWGMMIAGFGLAGGALRRRRRGFAIA